MHHELPEDYQSIIERLQIKFANYREVQDLSPTSYIRESVDSLCRDGANAHYKSRITSQQMHATATTTTTATTCNNDKTYLCLLSNLDNNELQAAWQTAC